MRIKTLREMGFVYKAVVCKISYKNVLGINNISVLHNH